MLTKQGTQTRWRNSRHARHKMQPVDATQRAEEEGASTEKLHQRVVDWRAGGLNQKHVRVSHILAQLDVAFAIVEARD